MNEFANIKPAALGKVLLLAETANPEWTSVPLIGWSLCKALSDRLDTHIVTQVRNRAAFLRAGLREGEDFTVIDNDAYAASFWRIADRLKGGSGKGWTMSTAFASLAYYTFEQQVWSRFKTRLLAGEFALVHRVTPVSPTSQSPIAPRLARAGIPFIIGPLNGGIPWPPHFKHRQMAERDWLSDIRALYRLMPYFHATRRSAAAILCGSRHTLDEMPSAVKDRCIYLPENGVDLAKFPPGQRRMQLPLQAAFVGRLVPYKGADLLLRAARPQLRAGRLHLHIVGDGPQMPELRRLAAEFDIASHVTFHGWVPHQAIHDILGHCDFTVLPSIREFGGGVVLESLAMGLPAIIADYGGPAELIDSSRGVRVPFTDEQSLLSGLASAINRWVEDPALLAPLGASGRTFIETSLTWEAKAAQVETIYRSVLDGRRALTDISIFTPTPPSATVGER